jgi:hypothetical protein
VKNWHFFGQNKHHITAAIIGFFLALIFSLHSISAGLPLSCIPQQFHNNSTTLTKYIFGDKVTLTSSTVFFANKIMRLSNYYLGAYPLTYITTNHGTDNGKVADDISIRYQYRVLARGKKVEG